MDNVFYTGRGIDLYNASIMDFNNSLSQLPSPSAKRIALRISPAAERALRQGHPWIFDQSIIEQSHKGAPGDLAVIFDDDRRFLAVGLYDPDSPIRVRILHRGAARRLSKSPSGC